MTLTNWITIILGLLTFSTTLFLAFKQGHFKKIKLEFSPAKIINPINDGVIDYKRKPRIPVIAILKFFEYNSTGFNYFCSHIYLSFENRCKYEIEDVVVLLTYPRRYFDENDKDFLRSESTDPDDSKNSFVMIEDGMVQMKYKIKNIHPYMIRQIMHPIIQPIKDFNRPMDFDNPFLSSVNGKNFSFYKVDVSISAKNLAKPIHSNFWIVNILNRSYSEFFKNEKLFIYDLSKLYTYPKRLFEIHKITSYNIGEYKKDALVVMSEHPKITYSHFKPIQSPLDGSWNFEQETKSR